MGAPLEVTDPADGSVEWDKAEEFFRGKAQATEPEDGADDQTEQPAESMFRYKGKEIKADPETVELLEDLRRQARGENGKLGAELARTRERLARLEGAVTRPTGDEAPAKPKLERPDHRLATRDYAEYDRQMQAYEAAKDAELEARLAARLEADREQLRRSAEKAQHDREWAERFYSEHDHLDKPTLKPIVAQAYTEHKSEIDEIEAGEGIERAHERLAELAHARLVEVSKVVAPNRTNTSRRPPRVESSGGAPQSRTQPVDESRRNFSAASWSAKERARMRGDAAKT